MVRNAAGLSPREILNRLFQVVAIVGILTGGSASSAVGRGAMTRADTHGAASFHGPSAASVLVNAAGRLRTAATSPPVGLLMATVIAAYAAGRLARVMNDDPVVH